MLQANDADANRLLRRDKTRLYGFYVSRVTNRGLSRLKLNDSLELAVEPKHLLRCVEPKKLRVILIEILTDPTVFRSEQRIKR